MCFINFFEPGNAQVRLRKAEVRQVGRKQVLHIMVLDVEVMEETGGGCWDLRGGVQREGILRTRFHSTLISPRDNL